MLVRKQIKSSLTTRDYIFCAMNRTATFFTQSNWLLNIGVNPCSSVVLNLLLCPVISAFSAVKTILFLARAVQSRHRKWILVRQRQSYCRLRQSLAFHQLK